MRDGGALDLDAVPRMIDRLIADGVEGLFVCGSTGEGSSLTVEERRATAEAFVDAAGGRVPVIVHVGHNSLTEASGLAGHAQKIGAAAIAAAPPSYFRPASIKALVQCVADVTLGAPETPFFYYHIPSMSGVDFDMLNFLEAAAAAIPTLAGVKFTSERLDVFQVCAEFEGGRFKMLFGRDEMLAAGLAAGASGAVGGTYNFASPLYRRLIAAHEDGDVDETRRLQSLAIHMIRELLRSGCGFQPAAKSLMKLVGENCGPSRLPLESPSPKAFADLEERLRAIGFFDWARTR